MASYQVRDRDPLLDSQMRAMIERRGRELAGLVLIGLGVAMALMMGSYTPEDPGWMAATDEAAQNALGRVGASVAAALFILVGHGGWALVVLLLGWGVRCVLHRGVDRVLARLIFAPIAVALAAIYAATLVPGAGWDHSFGLGGLFGDTILGALLNVAPVQTPLALKVLSGLLGLGVAALGLFVLGFERGELRALGRYLLVGLVVAYAAVLTALSRALNGTARAATSARARHAERRAARRDAAPEAARPAETAPRRAAPVSAPSRASAPAAPPEPEPATQTRRPGFLAALVRRPDPPEIEDELVEPALSEAAADCPPPGDDRIRARINDAIKARTRRGAVLRINRAEPPVRRDNTPPAEPPLTASRTAADTPAAQEGLSLFDPVEAEAPPTAAPPAATPPRPSAAPAGRVVQPPARRTATQSARASAEAQPALNFDHEAPQYELPPLSLLTNPAEIERHYLSEDALEQNARMLETVLDDYGVKGDIVQVRPGPVVTMYELEPAPGLKASRVIGLADDIARSMSALSARVSTVPGRSVIGIELPNASREKVVLRENLAARDFGDSRLTLPLALGKGIDGDPIVANLAKMPHLLIAGTTGSGKSVAINTMILSLLYKLTPEECRLIMIDPKMLELSVYDGIPHLLSPVVTDPKKAVVALKWVVAEMEERYRKMSKMGVRNIEGFNGRVREAQAKGEMFKRTVQTGFDDETGDPVFETEEFAPETMPYIVVIVDEMADLMMVAGKEIEACIQRLAQMARASGIHLIMATQRPSVDVITGTIKANFPTRISFQVTSKIDSRTILGEQGAEQLLGMGDMLYMAGGARIQRIHGPFVSDEEVEDVVNHLKSFGPPDYQSGVVDGPEEGKESEIDQVLGLGGNTDGEDALYDQAVAIVAKDRKCSTSYIQRKLAIGYNKAARLVEQMEDQGVVSPANHVGKREVLVPEA